MTGFITVRRTELTSGTPLSPSDPRSGVVEALQGRGGGVYRISAGADSRVRRSRRVDTTITTTRVSFGYRHCYSAATVVGWEGWMGWWVCGWRGGRVRTSGQSCSKVVMGYSEGCRGTLVCRRLG
jgi:hypothetical protein